MRRWLLIFLLAFLPLQLTWAAVSPYCQHEKDANTSHFGHHEHQHKAADGKEASPDPAKLGGGDPDCAACHAGCVSALPGTVTTHVIGDSDLGIAHYHAHLAAPPLERLDRPQWHVLA